MPWVDVQPLLHPKGEAPLFLDSMHPTAEGHRRIAARTVILVSFNEPNRELAEALTAQGRTAHLIGDVRARSSIMSAIHGAAELGRRI